MVTLIISAALSAAVTTGVCLWAYCKGKADGAYEAYRERSMSSDLLPLMALSTMAGFGTNKGFTTSDNAPKDDAIDKFINSLKEDELEKLIKDLKSNCTSCPCKQQEEDSSQS